ncbi:MAG TPA: folate-binding protein [Parvibaculum sp.]
MGELKAAVLPERGVLRVGGPEARPFLQNLVTNNVDLADGKRAVYSGLLTPQGKFLFDFIISADGDGLLLDCDGARAADLVKRLNFYKLRAQVTVEDASATHKVVAVWGGEVKAKGAITDPRLPALGARIVTDKPDDALKASGADEATPADYHSHRIGLGVGDAAHDFEPDRTFPLEVNFDEMNGIDFQKGCFIGQEVTSRTKRRGSVRKRLLPCIVEGDLPRPHTPVRAAAREVGTVFSGDAGTGRVMALLRLDLINGATLEAGNSGLTPEKPAWATFEIEGVAGDDDDA